jgi:hypothetical protein
MPDSALLGFHDNFVEANTGTGEGRAEQSTAHSIAKYTPPNFFVYSCGTLHG